MRQPPSGALTRSAREEARPRAFWGSATRLAGVGLVLVLLMMSAFPLWASLATAEATQRAYRAARLADDYSRAAAAVAAEESLERKYRLEPFHQIRAEYEQAAGGLLAAMTRVRADGDQADRVRVEQILAAHGPYLTAVDKMFAAVDQGDPALAEKVDTAEADPRLQLIEKTVNQAATAHHAQAIRALTGLRGVTRFTSRATPAVLAAGLLLAAMFSLVLLRVRRQLDHERQRAMHGSLHDSLTGLPNRTLLADRFEQALRAGRRDGTPTGLLLLDLDRFKEVNDTLGHQAGDRLLVQIGARLARALREVDTVARLGGDEFAVLLPKTADVQSALMVAQRLRAALDEPFTVDGVDLDVEASVGVVVSGAHGYDSNTLLRRADVAMYVAKAQNVGVFAYDPDVDRNSPERLALLGQLRRALDRSELIVHYQPKVSLSTGEVCGTEALVRWQHPERGLIPPDRFIPLAEHTGLIVPLTRYVLDHALTQTRAWADAGHRIPVAVNLSARNLLDPRLIEEITELLEATGVPADMLELEVTESAIIIEPSRARQLLTRLRDLGVRIAVDDFGAGYSSLGQLRSLPVSQLKVDRSFVLTMDTDDSNAMIVQSVVDLGHNLGLTVVAEGVETETSMATLAAYGCDVAQGYHLSRPLPPEALLAWYTDRIGRSTEPTAPSPR